MLPFAVPVNLERNKTHLCIALAKQVATFIRSKDEDADCIVVAAYETAIITEASPTMKSRRGYTPVMTYMWIRRTNATKWVVIKDSDMNGVSKTEGSVCGAVASWCV